MSFGTTQDKCHADSREQIGTRQLTGVPNPGQVFPNPGFGFGCSNCNFTEHNRERDDSVNRKASEKCIKHTVVTCYQQ